MPREPEPLDDLPSRPVTDDKPAPSTEPRAETPRQEKAAPPLAKAKPKFDIPKPKAPDATGKDAKAGGKKSLPVAWVAAFFLLAFLLAMLLKPSGSSAVLPQLTPEEARAANTQFEIEARHYFEQFLDVPLPASAVEFDAQRATFRVSPADADLLRSALHRAEKNWDKSRLKLPPHGLEREIPGEGLVSSLSFVPRYQAWHPDSEQAANFESTQGLHLVISVSDQTQIVQILTTHPE